MFLFCSQANYEEQYYVQKHWSPAAIGLFEDILKKTEHRFVEKYNIALSLCRNTLNRSHIFGELEVRSDTMSKKIHEIFIENKHGQQAKGFEKSMQTFDSTLFHSVK